MITIDPKNLFSYNPIPTGCVLYCPFWHPNLRGGTLKSIDLYGTSIAVTGPTKVVTGYDFDGVDDYMTITDKELIQNMWDSGGTLIGWFNVDSDGGDNLGRIYNKGNECYVGGEAGGKVKVKFDYPFSGASLITTTTATALTIGAWELLAITYTATAGVVPVMYVGSTTATPASVSVTESLESVGTRNTDVGTDIRMGIHASSAGEFDGTFGEYALYNRALTLEDIVRYHAHTVRRYM
jgi:hypothetical protein|tara:strand:- start:7527 stop:8240 length:714 start_codon:yes stop_codon:yes gene_type:complete